MSIIFFIGTASFETDELRPYWRNHQCLALSLVRYADDDMQSPSCCDWLIPGTFSA